MNNEVVISELPIEGALPEWLSGTLIRNGPAKFEAGNKKLRHWFDGFAMLHQFAFQDGKVSYANKFLESDAYRYVKAKGKMGYSEFATDPCRSIFKRFFQAFSPRPTDNANVNVSMIADKFVALTETPMPIVFDPQTLERMGVINYEDKLKGNLTTAHPHYDFEKKEGINYLTVFSAKSTYQIYRVSHHSKTRELLGSIPVKEPGYMHSFGMTQNYVILAEYPFFVNPLNLLLNGNPFIENFHWKPNKGTHFYLLDRKTGKFQNYKTESFFAFHHVNAFEENDKVIVDIIAYPNTDIIQSLYLDVLRGETNKNIVSAGELRRYEINLLDSSVNYVVLSEEPIELPRINYFLSNTKNYRFVYGVGSDKNDPNNFLNRLLKIDVQQKATKIWKETMCYPGEPVFVSLPNAKKEDDGVILSVVLNAQKGNSFLLILDAVSFKEIARASVPHHIPFGFHGQFYK
ncbi:carotenoid oxygenase family protein [Coxiella burnetii]|uniref:carotenoid oxygenase family protein n=1 Tax=Coxiella burnetii TaxID=777 RepID=UPI00222EA16B|nr:carotenoid oxygenase family protein [Coxiella burnetii]